MNEPKETILITGTSGWLGYPVAKRLAETFNVVGFDPPFLGGLPSRLLKTIALPADLPNDRVQTGFEFKSLYPSAPRVFAALLCEKLRIG